MFTKCIQTFKKVVAITIKSSNKTKTFTLRLPENLTQTVGKKQAYEIKIEIFKRFVTPITRLLPWTDQKSHQHNDTKGSSARSRK